MEFAEGFKYGVFGLIAGIALAVVAGFAFGGWVTGGRADRMAADKVRAEVTSVLVPHCIEKATTDPNFGAILAQMKSVGGNVRTRILIQAGWATLLPTAKPDLVIADACMERLIAEY